MPAYKCPKCGVDAAYEEHGAHYTVPHTTAVYLHCIELEQKKARGESIDGFKCGAIVKEAQRLRERRRG